MGLNYDISVVVYDEDDNALSDVKIHAFFNKVNDNSSESAWNQDIQLTTGTGKTSFNLGDDSFLTSDGKIDNGDTILITAWLTDNSDTTIDDKQSKDVNTITRCVNFIHTVDTSESSWTETFIALSVKNPVCDFIIDDASNTGHDFSITNNSYTENGPFSVSTENVNRDDLYQSISYYSENLFLGLEIKETEYNLIEIDEIVSSTGDYSYSYINAGDYDCVLTVRDYLGFYCETKKSYHILFNEPNIDFDFTFTKLLNSDKHIGVGNDDEMKITQLSSTNFGDTWDLLSASFDWYIYDLDLDGNDNTDEYLNEDVTKEPTKFFLSPTESSEKYIKLTINWNDGFDDQILEKTLVPVLDTYSISQNIHWETQKSYIVDGIYVPLGDDDLVSVYNDNIDNASQDYDSNSQWKTLKYTAVKKLNDGSDDTEIFNLSNDNGDDYNDIIKYYIKYYHNSDDYTSIEQELVYWNGYEDITKNLKKNFVTEKYTIKHNFHWETSLHGYNAVIVNDADEIIVYNDSIFEPQDNQNIVTKDKYDVTKDKYTSYTDDTIVSDNETFEYDDGNLTNTPSFYVGKDGNLTVLNTITYYDGYDEVISTKTLTLTVEVMTPNIVFSWFCNSGENGVVIGRDDEVTFVNSSYLIDYYDKEYSKTSTRNLSIDWYMKNYKTAGNFSDINTIGGNTFSESEDYTDEFLGYGMEDEPKVNYWSLKTGSEAQSVIEVFYYNDGFFNRSSELEKFIKTEAYSDIIPNAYYNDNIKDRNDEITFGDNSTNNENRIINIDWSLTDRYEDNSMTEDKQGQDNKQVWLGIARDEAITTTINSNEDHTLSQDIIRWDNGYSEKTFTNSYTIKTLSYTINPNFEYYQKYETGPEIVFVNTSSSNTGAVLLEYDYEIDDTDNEGNDAYAEYRNIPISQTEQEHTYKSVSNSPFEDDIANKHVILFQDYDNGWNREYESFEMDILVKPNRITQNFILNPIRHESDTETEDNIITGNNPIGFYDGSTTERTDTDFIKYVKYSIVEECT